MVIIMMIIIKIILLIILLHKIVKATNPIETKCSRRTCEEKPIKTEQKEITLKHLHYKQRGILSKNKYRSNM